MITVFTHKCLEVNSTCYPKFQCQSECTNNAIHCLSTYYHYYSELCLPRWQLQRWEWQIELPEVTGKDVFHVLTPLKSLHKTATCIEDEVIIIILQDQAVTVPGTQNWHWTQHFLQVREDTVPFLPNLQSVQMFLLGLHRSYWMKLSLDYSPSPTRS